MRTQLLNVSAHELATPLTPIALQVYLLEKADPQSRIADHQVGISVIARGVARLRLLIRDILDASRVESGRLRLDLEDADLARLVRQAGEAITAAAKARGVELQVDAPESVPAQVDPMRIAQVLDNLLGNALKFTPRGGRIALALRVQGAAAVVTVDDTGPGLEPEQIRRLFQPFSQVHDPMQTTEKGSGLGLYISKAMVEAHGGRIWVESRGAGNGSTFGFEIPLRTA